MEAEQEKPKRPRREKAAIIPLPPPVEIRLGSLSVTDPKEMIHRAAQLADALANIVNNQMDEEGKPKLFVKIQGRKYVKADGWTTLGAMLGVVPVEESCTRLPSDSGFKGFEAKVKLVRMVDGAQVGGASAECTLNENNWKGKDSFTLRSMAITRATGKAFRLSFAWIMQLAGFEATPADELWEQGSEEDTQQVAKEKIEKAMGKTFATLEDAEQAYRASKKEERQTAKTSAFMAWPESHNGHYFLLTGKTALWDHGVTLKTIELCNGKWSDRDGGWLMPADYAPYMRKLLRDELKCPLIETGGDTAGVLQKSIEVANGNTERRKSATPIS
jgi:hypothetical protein